MAHELATKLLEIIPPKMSGIKDPRYTNTAAGRNSVKTKTQADQQQTDRPRTGSILQHHSAAAKVSTIRTAVSEAN